MRNASHKTVQPPCPTLASLSVVGFTPEGATGQRPGRHHGQERLAHLQNGEKQHRKIEKGHLLQNHTKEEARVTDFIQITTTTSTESAAQAIANALVERRLAVCAQVIGPITSTYWWPEEIETAEEWLCVIKSSKNRYKETEHAILELHSYETPEILVTPVTAGNARYLAWIDEALAG
jgi:periplasmic divalent cation tolerance protein